MTIVPLACDYAHLKSLRTGHHGIEAGIIYAHAKPGIEGILGRLLMPDPVLLIVLCFAVIIGNP
ncbi:hypothetical protein D3C87_1946460 [compost metagenome]